MRVYLAGKIGPNDWRHRIVKNLKDAAFEGFKDPWPTLKGAIFGRHDYVGPYFLGCDHSCYHGKNSHGAGAAGGGCGTFNPPARGEIAEQCLAAIGQADLVFAYIESADCYGTLFELGYAAAARKDVAVVFSNFIGITQYQDLWFVRAALGGAVSVAEELVARLEALLKEKCCHYCAGAEWVTNQYISHKFGGGRWLNVCAECLERVAPHLAEDPLYMGADN